MSICRSVIGASVLLVALTGCGGANDRAAPELVPATWRDVRNSPGHTVHLEKGTKCNACHPRSFAPADVLPCNGCHHEALSPLHLASKEASPDCQSCHLFGAASNVEPWGCKRCHVTDPSAPRPVSAAPAIAIHQKESCETCHVAHGPKQNPNCASCHPKLELDAEKHSCTGCHTGHAPKEQARDRCATCHEKPTALFADGHKACGDCHIPHEAKPKSCGSCHEETPSAKHQAEGCKSCHDVHDVKTTACVKCHENAKVEHRASEDLEPSSFAVIDPAADNAESCQTCHVPHEKKKPPAAAKSCSTCHTGAKTDRAAHDGKLTCAKCHVPHDFSSSPKTCADCHDTQKNAVAALEGHRDCSSCHQNGSHAPSTPKVACATCHEAQASTVHQGHQDCASCHEAHAGTLKRGAQTCASCHANEASSHHAKVEGSCATCHLPHTIDPAPRIAASCATCHAPASLPGLHASGGHQKCGSCHESHEQAPPKARADCLTCHTDRVQHEPKAENCSSCHPFRGSRTAPASPKP